MKLNVKITVCIVFGLFPLLVTWSQRVESGQTFLRGELPKRSSFHEDRTVEWNETETPLSCNRHAKTHTESDEVPS